MRGLKPFAIAVLLALALFLLDRQWSVDPTQQAEWLRAGDVEVRAVRAGAGDTTLFFLHGYLESLVAWRPLFERFARNYRVVAIDAPGSGLSDKPAGPYTLGAQEARLSDFLDRWTTGPVIVVGHSMGGELAAALAIDRPDRVVAAVLISPAGWGLADRLDSLRPGTVAAIGWAAAAAAMVLPVHDPAWIAEPKERADYDPVRDPPYRAAATAVMREFDFGALADSTTRLRQPVLLIWGREDPTIPFAIGSRVAATLPCVTFEPLASTMHRPHETDPDTVIALMDGFLARPKCGPAN
ncbi:MAG: alpha/beta fold hydrolase [Gemmatimonadales bacterium]